MTPSESTAAEITNQKYSRINKFAENGSVVFFGSTYFSELPICELIKDVGLSETVYNRSITGMSIYDAKQYLDNCILNLQPVKIFIEIGEADLTENNFNINDFISEYEWLLYSIHNKTKAKIHIVSPFGPEYSSVVSRLRILAEESGCEFIDISEALSDENSEYKVIQSLKYYIRNKNIDFSTAMNL